MFVSFNSNFSEQTLVFIEVDIHKGIPVIDIVGLAGSAIREARDRIKAALLAQNLELPKGHILVNLAPAASPKNKVCMDLAIAVSIVRFQEELDETVLVMGELNLKGGVRKAEGLLPALIEAKRQGIDTCIIPEENSRDLDAFSLERTIVVSNLWEAIEALKLLQAGSLSASRGIFCVKRKFASDRPSEFAAYKTERAVDSDDTNSSSLISFDYFLHDKPRLFALVAAVTGAHNLILFGPPGTGKTTALDFLVCLVPRLEQKEFVEVNRLYSLSNNFSGAQGLIKYCPIRKPHHSSSTESILGSRQGFPGEISFAHRGILVLDECAEFKRSFLQALREPLDEAQVWLGRVGHTVRHPAAFSLALSMNSCPCGGLGSEEGICLCKPTDIQRYWARVGAALLDRIDIRIFSAAKSSLESSEIEVFTKLDERLGKLQSLEAYKQLISEARQRQYLRNPRDAYEHLPKRNGDLRGLEVDRLYAYFSQSEVLAGYCKDLGPRALHSFLKLARSFADLLALEEPDALCFEASKLLRRSYEPAPGVFIQN